MLRLAFVLVLVGLLCGGFAVCGIADGRWRDALEGGVPALLLVVGGLLAGRRTVRR